MEQALQRYSAEHLFVNRGVKGCLNPWEFVCLELQIYVGFGVAGLEGVHVGVDEVAGAVASIRGLVLAADDGEGAQDVAGILSRDAVEVEVEGVQAGAQVAALFFVPDEGRAARSPGRGRTAPCRGRCT